MLSELYGLQGSLRGRRQTRPCNRPPSAAAERPFRYLD
jgi:hypothetical protein